MKFRINIGRERTNIRLNVERTHLDERIEHFTVTGRNGGIVIESKRPLFRNKRLKHRRIDWKQIEGQKLDSHIGPKYVLLLTLINISYSFKAMAKNI